MDKDVSGVKESQFEGQRASSPLRNLFNKFTSSISGPSSGEANASNSPDQNQRDRLYTLEGDDEEFYMIQSGSDIDVNSSDGDVDKITLDSRDEEILSKVEMTATVLASVINYVT